MIGYYKQGVSEVFNSVDFESEVIIAENIKYYKFISSPMVEIKLETGNNATGLGKIALYIIIASVAISAIFMVIGILMFFYLNSSGFFAP